MITRSFNLDKLLTAVGPYPELNPDDFDWAGWLDYKANYMYVDGDDVGLATHEYPGLYTVHWFFTNSRGRKALDLAKEMLHRLFEDADAKAVRGLTKATLRAARWASRQVGFKSYGLIETKDGEHELFYMTKDEFYSNKKDNE